MDIFPLEIHEFNSICYSKLPLNENINMKDIMDNKYIDFNSIKAENNELNLKNKNTSYYINKAKEESENVLLEIKDQNEIELSKKMHNSLSKTLTKEEKQKRRKLKNCISSRKVQLKKRKYTELLEDYIVYLENENYFLQN